ncbi:hypothetical protein FACS189427_13620 [Planctomycetales bacterium]|nr:hypothetical protein FACS189427_13620 [Planctomycetales bacterium]
MTEGRDKHIWSIASAMMALIANCHLDSKRSAVTADDFNPTLHNENRNVILITDENVNVMRDEFIKVFQTI